MHFKISFLFLLFSGVALAQTPPANAPLDPGKVFVQDVAQDAGGQLWASIASYPTSGLFRWNASGQWQPVSLPDVTGQPDALAQIPSGAVVCLWDKGDNNHDLTGHRGTFSRVIAHFSGFLRDPRLFGDTAGNVWVLGLGGDIYRVSARVGDHSPPEHVLTLADTDYYPGYQKSNNGGDEGREAGLFFHDPLFAMPDGKGRMWFWTDRLAGGDNFAGLRGVLRWENGKMVHYASLAGLPDKPLNWVAARDPGRVWIALRSGGIYEVDTETLRGVPVPEPEPRAFQSVQKMFALGSDWYVVSGGSVNTTTGTLDGTLWRLRAGQWRKVLPGLDSQTVFQDFSRRPVLRTAEGLWVGAYGSGAWLLPSTGGVPIHLDWRYGYALTNTNRLFALPLKSGGVVAFRGNNANGATVSPMQAHLEQHIAHPVTGALRTLDTNHPLVQDPTGHVWNLNAPSGIGKGQATLSEWDGDNWVPHPLPPDADPAEVSSLSVDSLGRLWLLPWIGQKWERATYIYDPADGHWQTFPSYARALLAQMDKPSFALGTVAFGAHQRVAYRDDTWHLHFFDGHIWHDWVRSDIIPHDTLFAFEAPFFGKDGGLRVNIDHNSNLPDKDQKSWAWSESTGWHAEPYEEGPHDWIVGIRNSRLVAPPNCPPPDSFSLVKDNLGTYWLTSSHRVYKATETACTPIFASGQVTPFADGRRITAAMTDPKGNTFLLTENGNAREYVLVSAQTK